MKLLKAGIAILAILQLLMFLAILSDATATSMFVVAGFSPLFLLLTLLLMLEIARKLRKLEKELEPKLMKIKELGERIASFDLKIAEIRSVIDQIDLILKKA